MATASASAGAARNKRSTSARSAKRKPSGVAGIGARVRWDRLGRTAILCVLVALAYLYMSAGVHMLSTWRQSKHDNAVVATLRHEHTQLVRQHQTLIKQSTLEAEARQLGMMKKNEQPYLVGSLPND